MRDICNYYKYLSYDFKTAQMFLVTLDVMFLVI